MTSQHYSCQAVFGVSLAVHQQLTDAAALGSTSSTAGVRLISCATARSVKDLCYYFVSSIWVGTTGVCAVHNYPDRYVVHQASVDVVLWPVLGLQHGPAA